MIAFLAITFLCGIVACVYARGHFGYTLDDPYIHLALAERLAAGHYGINLGEPASPSSSILWPFLLIVGAGTPWHQYLPFAINVVCGVITAALIGIVVDESWLKTASWSVSKRCAVALLFVVIGNLSGLAFTGLEHSAQVLIASICAFGIIEALFERRIPLWCLFFVALGPSIRYEMFALVAAMVITLAGMRQWRAAFFLGVGSLVVPAVFSLFLLSAGLPALPSSVISKASGWGGWTGLFAGASQGDLIRIPFACLIAGILFEIVSVPATKRWPLIGALLGLGLQLFAGRFGGFFRYEPYAMVFGALIFFRAIPLSSSGKLGERTVLPVIATAILLFCALPYAIGISRIPRGVQNIYEQQYQMHRFVDAFWDKNFAVNDLGWVSYQVDPRRYVLDLNGLASPEALLRAHKDSAWLDEIVTRKNTPLVMIYPDWFEGIPDTWVKVASLDLSGPRVSPARSEVVFFATGKDAADDIRAKLRKFAPTLPADVEMHIQ
ncbi:hypothetical protein FXB40_26710 [Bradyrhizobium rifense]|uniref:Glycosyltransferase RgtA/B/C/D-like domain-containing protein n=1 Tax=Bradyrhizobium rifense TaxID=515499 RepID=A0A5D3KCX1_9BRAD|nr:hypothetical protein [Bradyrhizobium rifense]TYL92039.1 hypothetical protein FXB40_26710 [Bradyrhizobium rifense]